MRLAISVLASVRSFSAVLGAFGSGHPLALSAFGGEQRSSGKDFFFLA